MAASEADVNGDVDFLIVTALDEERNAVLARIPMSRVAPSDDDVRVYFSGMIGQAGCEYTLALVSLLGMGRVEAATATADAIRRWSPRFVVLVGIAGGNAAKDVRLGDVLVADQVVDYEQQKVRESGATPRFQSYRCDARLLGAAHCLGGEWASALAASRPDGRRPYVHFGPVLTGDKVVASSAFMKDLLEHYPQAVGLEMEAGGAAPAAFQAANKPGFFMVRGVSDLADQQKGSKAVEQWRRHACDAACEFLVALLRSEPVPRSRSNPR